MRAGEQVVLACLGRPKSGRREEGEEGKRAHLRSLACTRSTPCSPRTCRCSCTARRSCSGPPLTNRCSANAKGLRHSLPQLPAPAASRTGERRARPCPLSTALSSAKLLLLSNARHTKSVRRLASPIQKHTKTATPIQTAAFCLKAVRGDVKDVADYAPGELSLADTFIPSSTHIFDVRESAGWLEQLHRCVRASHTERTTRKEQHASPHFSGSRRGLLYGNCGCDMRRARYNCISR